MDRTLEVLEGNVDRLLTRHSALISERNGLQAAVDELQRRNGQLESGLAAARSEVARLEQLLGRESGRSRKAAGEIQSLIDRLEGLGEMPQITPVQRPAPVSQSAADKQPAAVPRQEVRAPQAAAGAVMQPAADKQPVAVPRQESRIPQAVPAVTPPPAADRFESAVLELRGVAFDREHATAATGMNKRLF